MAPLVWLIPLFPLAGALVNALFGRLIGRRAHWIAVPALGASFVASCAVFLRVWRGETWTGDLFPWISAGTFQTAVTAQVDQLSAVMLLVVTGVGFLIHLYSVGYMHGDAGYARFFAYLNLFVFSMVMLVLAGDFLLLYVFWEAVGLCSYLLIGFWYERPRLACSIRSRRLARITRFKGFWDMCWNRAKRRRPSRPSRGRRRPR